MALLSYSIDCLLTARSFPLSLNFARILCTAVCLLLTRRTSLLCSARYYGVLRHNTWITGNLMADTTGKAMAEVHARPGLDRPRLALHPRAYLTCEALGGLPTETVMRTDVILGLIATGANSTTDAAAGTTHLHRLNLGHARSPELLQSLTSLS